MEIHTFIPGLEIARERLEVFAAPRISKSEADILFKKIIKRLFPSIRKCRENGQGWGLIRMVILTHTGADIPEPFLVRQYDILKSFSTEDGSPQKPKVEPQEQPKQKRTRRRKPDPDPGVIQIGLKSIRIEDTDAPGDGENNLQIPGERPQQPL